MDLESKKEELKQQLETITNNINKNISFLDDCLILENEIKNKPFNNAKWLILVIIEYFKKNQNVFDDVNTYALKLYPIRFMYFRNEDQENEIRTLNKIFSNNHLNKTSLKTYKDLLNESLKFLENY